MEIFKRKCPHCLKAVPFRAREERAGGKVKVTTVACTSCGVVIGVLPYMGAYPEKREMESIVRGIVRTQTTKVKKDVGAVKRHINAAVKKLRRRPRRGRA